VPISGNELLVLLVLAAFLIGPERLPGYVEQVRRVARGLRDLAQGARDRVSAELGPEIGDVDWSQLDPRRYDPRRIVRDALLEDRPGDSAGAFQPVPGARPASDAGAGLVPGEAPFDDDAT
jgi:sec-independent protein translocase protein TatB